MKLAIGIMCACFLVAMMILFTFAMCKVASDTDDKMEMEFNRHYDGKLCYPEEKEA